MMPDAGSHRYDYASAGELGLTMNASPWSSCGDGRQRVYRLNGGGLRSIYGWVKNYEDSWSCRFGAS